jgi:hypothetical protein
LDEDIRDDALQTSMMGERKSKGEHFFARKRVLRVVCLALESKYHRVQALYSENNFGNERFRIPYFLYYFFVPSSLFESKSIKI